jgi:hypothetical protein
MLSLNAYRCTAGELTRLLEAADCAANTTIAGRGRWLLPLLQLLTGAAVWLANQVDLANE